MRTVAPWVAALAVATGLPSPVTGLELAPVTIRIENNVWLLNADAVRQPMVPLQQKLLFPSLTFVGDVIVTPTRNAVVRLNIPDDFGIQPPATAITVTVSRRTDGERVLLANPTNRLDPFTAQLVNRADGDAGTASRFGGPAGGRGGDFPLNLRSRLIVDEVDVGSDLFFLEIPFVGAFGMNATIDFSGAINLLDIPVNGTAMGQGYTTGMLTLSRSVITARRNGDPLGTPTGFRAFTFMTTGSFEANRTSTVTPFVVESLTGAGDTAVPFALYGFLRSTLTGVTFLPEPGSLFTAAALVALWGGARLRRRAGSVDEGGRLPRTQGARAWHRSSSNSASSPSGMPG